MSHYKIHYIITISTRLMKYKLKCIHREKKARGKWRVDLKEYIKKGEFKLDDYGDSLKVKKKKKMKMKLKLRKKITLILLSCENNLIYF